MSKNAQQKGEHIFDCLYTAYGIDIKELGDYYILSDYFNVQICTILRFHLGN